MSSDRLTRFRSSVRRSSPRIALILTLLAAGLVVTLAAGDAAAYSIGPVGGEPIALISPATGSVTEEASIILSWQRDPAASEYVVFVSTGSLDGRSADDLVADASIHKATTKIASIPLQDVV